MGTTTIIIILPGSEDSIGLIMDLAIGVVVIQIIIGTIIIPGIGVLVSALGILIMDLITIAHGIIIIMGTITITGIMVPDIIHHIIMGMDTDIMTVIMVDTIMVIPDILQTQEVIQAMDITVEETASPVILVKGLLLILLPGKN